MALIVLHLGSSGCVCKFEPPCCLSKTCLAASTRFKRLELSPGVADKDHKVVKVRLSGAVAIE
jgi:hypothetical protein